MTYESMRPQKITEIKYNSLMSIGQLARNLERAQLGNIPFTLKNTTDGMTKLTFEWVQK